MLFFRALFFLICLGFSFNVWALPNNVKNYLVEQKGYTPEQVQAYEEAMAQRVADRKAGKEISTNTPEQQEIYEIARSTEAIGYGNDLPFADRLLGGFAQATGLDQVDTVAFDKAMNTASAVSYGIGVGALTGAAGLATGGGLLTTALKAFMAGALTKEGVEAFLNREGYTFIKTLFLFSSYENGCWFCPIFRTLFDASNAFAANIAANLRDALTSLLELGFLFYILFKVLQSFLSFGAIEPKKFISELFFPFLKVAVVVLLLSDMGMKNIYRYAINPIAELSVGFALDINQTANDSGFINIRVIDGAYEIPRACLHDIYVETDTIGFSPGVINSIQCFLITQSSALIQKMAVGVTFMADCWGMGWLNIFPNFYMLFVGLFLFVVCFMLFISFPFKLVDSMVRLMIFSALLPLWIVLWIFPATKQNAIKGFKLFFDVLVTFICLSVILVMVIIILEHSFDGLSDWDTFINLLKDDQTEEAFKMIDCSGRAFFIFVAMLFMANALVKMTDSFAAQFGGSGSLGIGDGLSSKVMALGQATGRVGVLAAGKTLKDLGKGVGMAGKMIKNGHLSDSDTASAPHRFFGDTSATESSDGAAAAAASAAESADAARRAASKVDSARTAAQNAESLARVAAHTAEAASAASSSISSANRATSAASSSASSANRATSEAKTVTDESKRTDEQLKKTLNNLRSGSPESSDTLTNSVNRGSASESFSGTDARTVDSVSQKQTDNAGRKETKTSEEMKDKDS